MLRQLAVNNIVLVERLELEFEPGLGVLTGETGAGKSILLDALGLALGARADTALVRAGQEAASVSAEIALADDHPALSLLTEQGNLTGKLQHKNLISVGSGGGQAGHGWGKLGAR